VAHPYIISKIKTSLLIANM